MLVRSLARCVVTLGLVVALAACGGTATPPPAGATGAPSSSAPSAAASTAPSAAGSTASSGGADGFEGNFKTSGLYSATWTVAPDMPPNPFNSVTNPTLTSDKGTFGNIVVKPDGSLSFGSAAPGFSGAYKGTGAKVTLDSTGQFVCAFTVDTDLTGTNDQKILHIAGAMTVHWHETGLICP